VASGPSGLIAIEPSPGDRGQQEEQQRDDQHRAVLPADRPDAEEQQHAVRRQDVADEEQQPVDEADHDQEQAATPEHPADRPRIAADLGLPARDLRYAVPEEQAEQRERPAVDQCRREQDQRVVDGRPVLREAAENHRTLDEVVRVRQRDEQQHEATGQVRPEGPRPQAGGAADGPFDLL
jgi:hypothetical protein